MVRNGIEKEKGRMCPVFFYALQRMRRGGGACAGILMPSERRMHVNGQVLRAEPVLGICSYKSS